MKTVLITKIGNDGMFLHVARHSKSKDKFTITTTLRGKLVRTLSREEIRDLTANLKKL